MQITKEEEQKLSRKMKLKDQQQKYMLKRVRVMLDMLVKKLPYLLVVELLTDQKGNQTTKRESLIKVRKN